MRLTLKLTEGERRVNVILFYGDATNYRFTGNLLAIAANIKLNIRSNYLFDLNFTIENLLCPTRLQGQE